MGFRHKLCLSYLPLTTCLSNVLIIILNSYLYHCMHNNNIINACDYVVICFILYINARKNINQLSIINYQLRGSGSFGPLYGGLQGLPIRYPLSAYPTHHMCATTGGEGGGRSGLWSHIAKS